MTSSDAVIDLRSDTLTQPSPAMREAMANARVGDDVLDEDPTMAELQARVAELTGQAAGLWMPSGSQSNLTALMLHLRRGDRFIAPANAHVITYELGTSAWLAGGMPLELPWSETPGVPRIEDVAAAAAARGPYYALQPSLLCLENTHNHAGGTIVPPAVFGELVEIAHAHGLAVHLDGARIWHAAAALGVPIHQLTAAADTVSVCLSKGLGAPVGSVLCGDRTTIAAARRVRKMLGGGVRQGGVLAAAGLVALDQELPRIDSDRVRALTLAAGLRAAGWQANEPQTNIIMVTCDDAAGVAEAWAQRGVRASVMGTNIRLVTHRDLSDADITTALDRIGIA